MGNVAQLQRQWVRTIQLISLVTKTNAYCQCIDSFGAQANILNHQIIKNDQCVL